jgi:hypothetical protein
LTLLWIAFCCHTYLPRTSADIPEMAPKLKAMDTFSTSLKRKVEIFELTRCEVPPPFPGIADSFDLPYEQMLQIFPAQDYVLRIVCRRSIEIHRYQARALIASLVP